LLCGQLREAFGGMNDGFRRVSIRANLERVFTLDLQQVADLGQDPGDGEIVHNGKAEGGAYSDGNTSFDLEALGLDPTIENVCTGVLQGAGDR